MTRTVAGGRRGVRQAMAVAVTAAAFVAAPAGVAGADPAATPTPTPKPTMTATGGAQSAADTTAAGTTAAAGDVLDQLADEYTVGSGGGQLANLLKTCLQLRAMGFRPSKANLQEITAAMAYRPNQLPLIAALKDTIAYQGKVKAQMEILQQYQQNQANSAVMGAGQMPADSNPAALPGAPVPGTGPVGAGGAAMVPGAPPSP